VNRLVAENALGFALTLIGTLKVVAILSGNLTLYFFALSIAIAPLPLPFRSFDGYENFASYREYRVTFANGETATFTDHDLAKFLEGPHRAKIPILQAAMLLPVIDTNVSTSILGYSFCTERQSLQSLTGNANTISHVRVTTRTTTAGEGRMWTHSITCP